MSIKSCSNSKCQQINPQSINQFYKLSNKKPNEFRGKCKSCIEEQAKIYRKNNPNKRKEIIQRYRNKYPEKAHARRLKCYWPHLNTNEILNEYQLLILKYNNKCALCKVDQSQLKVKLNIDHNHKTGQIRGLLCNNCNRGIGHLQENLETIQNALNYLKEFK